MMCCGRFLRSFGIKIAAIENVDTLNRRSRFLTKYINWTFYSTFAAVFISFLAIFIICCLVFAALFVAAGNQRPECIRVSSEKFGSNPRTVFSDAFSLSWTTFTTVGYGNVYISSGNDFGTNQKAVHCSPVVALCTCEAFIGLLYAGLCGAILIGKVSRTQSRALLTFANAICLQYKEQEDEFVDDYSTDSDVESVSDEEDLGDDYGKNSSVKHMSLRPTSNVCRLKGCPVLKFQVVNDLSNKVGGDLIDATMKIVGVKNQRTGGKLTHSQYCRVELVDFENPFFTRVWHAAHVLDDRSPLLTPRAREGIKDNGGCWPRTWLQSPKSIRKKINFQNLIITVSGVSNISASTVYAYKQYKFSDVIVGFNFAPLVYENEKTGVLKVDMDLINDVIEQQIGEGDDHLRNSSESRDLATAGGPESISKSEASAKRSAIYDNYDRKSTIFSERT